MNPMPHKMITFELGDSVIKADGVVCWFIQRENPIHESPFYYVQEHSAAKKLPQSLRDAAQRAMRNLRDNSETLRSAKKHLRAAYKALVLTPQQESQ